MVDPMTATTPQQHSFSVVTTVIGNVGPGMSSGPTPSMPSQDNTMTTMSSYVGPRHPPPFAVSAPHMSNPSPGGNYQMRRV